MRFAIPFLLTLVFMVTVVACSKEDASECREAFEDRDFNKAMELCGEAAEDGSAEAQFIHASMLLALSEPTAVELGFKRLQQAVAQGHVGATFQLAMEYKSGNGDIIPKDEAKMLDLLKQANDKGHPYAAYVMLKYYNFNNIEISKEESDRLWQTSADRDAHGVQMMLAIKYDEEGKKKEALEMAKKAAEGGNIIAPFYLCALYDQGVDDSVSAKEHGYWCHVGINVLLNFDCNKNPLSRHPYLASHAQTYNKLGKKHGFSKGLQEDWDEDYQELLPLQRKSLNQIDTFRGCREKKLGELLS